MGEDIPRQREGSRAKSRSSGRVHMEAALWGERLRVRGCSLGKDQDLVRCSESELIREARAAGNTVTGGQVMGEFSVFQGARGHIRR